MIIKKRWKLVTLAAQLKKMIRSLLTVVSLCIITITNLFSQPEIKAVFTANPPVIDGLVNDDAWKNAALINELFQREPNPGDPGF